MHPEGGLLLHGEVDEADDFPYSLDATSFSDPISGVDMACLFCNLFASVVARMVRRHVDDDRHDQVQE